MRNGAMAELDVLAGQRRTTMRDAWFLEPAGLEVPGTASGEWLHDSVLVLRWQNLGGIGDATSDMVVVIGRSGVAGPDRWPLGSLGRWGSDLAQGLRPGVRPP